MNVYIFFEFNLNINNRKMIYICIFKYIIFVKGIFRFINCFIGENLYKILILIRLC